MGKNYSGLVVDREIFEEYWTIFWLVQSSSCKNTSKVTVLTEIFETAPGTIRISKMTLQTTKMFLKKHALAFEQETQY